MGVNAMSELRKHVSHMKEREIVFVNRMIRSKRYEFTNYSLERALTRGITNYSVMKTIRNGKLIEFHLKDDSPRALIRERANKSSNCTCVVIDMKSNTIVTAYKNFVGDKHSSLDEEIYDKDINIIEVLKGVL